jgi:hypothetical protein
MRCVVCASANCRWLRPLAVVSVALPVFFASTSAFAQSSEAAIANAATARSLDDAVDQNQKDLIGRDALGQSSGGAGGVGAFATGRLRTSDHDGLDIQPLVNTGVVDDGTRKTFSYETDEASVFANVVATLPGTVLGGQLKVSGFVGYNWLSLDLKSNAVSVLDPNQFGGAENDSVIAGGTVLWALQGTYALATLVGTWGETTLTDSVDDCAPVGCNLHRYKYDTSGFIGTLTAGHVYALAGPTGPMLDFRGTVSYTETDSDRFLNIHGDEFKLDFSTWTGTGGVTLFSNLSMQGNATLRPYVQAYVRQEWDYDSKLAFTQSGSGAFTLTAYDQSHLYGGVDAGLTYVLDKMTVGGAIYYEASSDEETVGGRLGASWALN